MWCVHFVNPGRNGRNTLSINFVLNGFLFYNLNQPSVVMPAFVKCDHESTTYKYYCSVLTDSSCNGSRGWRFVVK